MKRKAGMEDGYWERIDRIRLQKLPIFNIDPADFAPIATAYLDPYSLIESAVRGAAQEIGNPKG